jgi:hypothetical protein
MLLIWAIVIAVVCLAACLVWASRADYYDNSGQIMLAVVLAAILIVLAIVVPCQYISNISLEESVLATGRSIDEQSELLLSGDPSTSYGLEALEFKRGLQELIVERNGLIAMGEARLRSPWWLFKPNPIWR